MLRIGSVTSPVLLVAFSLALSGCPQREVSRVNPIQAKEQGKRIPVEINRDLDILFVIDNSGSMEEEQTSLSTNFPQFINVLNTIVGGLPNVHIGVISTDVGANTAISGCSQPSGDNGTLQIAPRVMGCVAPGPENFIIDVSNGDEMMPGRIDNHPMSTLAEAFSCIAELGITGCGFEQPLESMFRALNNNPVNAGFLRPNAFLAVIFIGDEDDCSASNFQVFDNNPSSVPVLGPLTSYRCFEFGVQCNPDDRNLVGLRADCVPRENSPYIYSVQRYVDFLKSLKSDPGKIIVAAIHGTAIDTNLAEPVNVGQDSNMNPALGPVCVSSSGESAPSVRIKAFLDSFPGNNTLVTICQSDLSTALKQVAEKLIDVIGNPCLEGDLKLDDNGVPLCTVTDLLYPNTDERQETVVKPCSSVAAALAEAPCWYVEPDLVKCIGENNQTHLSITVERNGVEPPVDTEVEVRCESN